MKRWPWSVLEIDDGEDERAVRRAYARLLKQRRADEDAEAFQALRAAYEHALILARRVAVDQGAMADVVGQEQERKAITDASYAKRGNAAQSEPVPSDRPQQPESSLRLIPREEDPAAEAARIWTAFSADISNVTSRREIKALFASTISIALRDELEWVAMMYCLRDDIPAESRGDIADVLNWREGADHLMRRNALLASQALSKIFADEEHRQARRHFPAAVATLEGPQPTMVGALCKLVAPGRRREMEGLLFALQVHFANARSLKFDATRIAFWREAIARRAKAIRFCLAAPMIGLWCGTLAALGLTRLGAFGTSPARGEWQWSIMGAGALLSMFAYGIDAFGASTPWARWQRIARDRAVVRYGWIVLWITASCMAYADTQAGIMTSVALAAMGAATVWAIAVHGLPRLAGLALLCAYAAFGFGFFGYYVRIAGGPWQIPIAQGVLYAIFAGFVQGELRAIVSRWRNARLAGTFVWLAAAGATAFVLLAMEFADVSSKWAEPAWSIYAGVIVVGGVLNQMQWAQLAGILPSVFRGMIYMAWVVLASIKPWFAAPVVLCLMSYWSVQDLKRKRMDRA
ncbi:hypothetical protein WL26_17205 [Burkholderia cepacia]|uniref:hypothetical protein n=1 Tax=Burkholderia cepacia TaxID=292 RepID=UPI000755C1E5|nr:hypothetical protein [Burkholderia cepacia]KWA11048.1 hypothetical protein WL26_17205 [Burkholderia cepacia]